MVQVVSQVPTLPEPRADELVSTRRFADALAAARTLPQERRARLEAAVALSHGRPDAWLSSRPAYLALLRRRPERPETLEARADVVLHRTLLGAWPTRDKVEALLAEAEAGGAGVAACLASLALRAAATTRDVRDLPELDALDEAGRDVRAGAPGALPVLVRVAHAYVHQDSARMSAARDLARTHLAPRDRSWIPVECVLEATGRPLPAEPTQWLERPEVVVARWVAIFEGYRRRALASS